MAKNRCFDILKDVTEMSGKLRYKEENPFQDFLAMTSASDSTRLENANKQLLSATKECEVQQMRNNEANEKYAGLEKKLNELEIKYEQLISGKLVSSAKTESVEMLKIQIANEKNILNMYRQATGVRLSFNGPLADAVSGYVAVKSDDPAQSKIEPFTIKNGGKNISNEIWKKISEVSETEIVPDNNISTLTIQK